MGGAAAKAARQLGLSVLGVRRSGIPHQDIDQMFRSDEIDKVLPLADFVVIATPLTPETRSLLNRERIGRMKQGASLINIGRAGVVDYVALGEALLAGKLSGTVLDVYDPEPLPPGSPLWTFDNVIIMPHVSSDDEDQYLPKSFDLVFENVRRLLSGKKLRNVVDRVRGY